MSRVTIEPPTSDTVKGMTPTAKVAFTVATMALLAGCSSATPATPPVAADPPPVAADPQPADTMPQWQEGEPRRTFTCTESQSGAVYSITLPTVANDPRLLPAEELRTRLGEAPVHYLIVDIDATQLAATHDAARVWKVQYATSTYESVQTTDIGETLDAWRADADTATFNDTITPGNKLTHTEPNRGAKGYEIQVVGQPITSMVAPSVLQSIVAFAPCE